MKFEIQLEQVQHVIYTATVWVEADNETEAHFKARHDSEARLDLDWSEAGVLDAEPEVVVSTRVIDEFPW